MGKMLFVCKQQNRFVIESPVAKMIDSFHDESSHLKYNDENSLAQVIDTAYFRTKDFYTKTREMQFNMTVEVKGSPGQARDDDIPYLNDIGLASACLAPNKYQDLL